MEMKQQDYFQGINSKHHFIKKTYQNYPFLKNGSHNKKKQGEKLFVVPTVGVVKYS